MSKKIFSTIGPAVHEKSLTQNPDFKRSKFP